MINIGQLKYNWHNQRRQRWRTQWNEAIESSFAAWDPRESKLWLLKGSTKPYFCLSSVVILDLLDRCSHSRRLVAPAMVLVILLCVSRHSFALRVRQSQNHMMHGVVDRQWPKKCHAQGKGQWGTTEQLQMIIWVKHKNRCKRGSCRNILKKM